MKLIFEKSVPGRRCTILPPCDVDAVSLPESLRRETKPDLPQLSETDISRHYTELCHQVHGVNCGFYPLGSCTMKYNPRIDEEMAALPGFTNCHPLAPRESLAGMRHVLDTAREYLCEITGMDGMTFQPAAGAHGEFTGVLLIKQYHDARGDHKRTKIIVPDSAHGTNPATAAMCGYEVVNIASGPDGCVDLDSLRSALGDDTAGLMLTNPNTVGIFDKNILEITRLVHEAGGLCYYDGANLNAVMGIVRPASWRRRSRRRRRGLQGFPDPLSAPFRPGGGARPYPGPQLHGQLPSGGPGADVPADPGPPGHPRGGAERRAQRQLSPGPAPGHLYPRL